ncbi:MAG: hypothetical protein IJ110_04220, partial [Lachnospiraceae bacterium]|nr:hypothetical protein [Lachnospiraceae bacterium]
MKTHNRFLKSSVIKSAVTLLTALSLSVCLTACGGSQGGSGDNNSQAPTPGGAVSSVAPEEGLLRTAVLYDITTLDVAKTTDDYMVPMNI